VSSYDDFNLNDLLGDVVEYNKVIFEKNDSYIQLCYTMLHKNFIGDCYKIKLIINGLLNHIIKNAKDIGVVIKVDALEDRAIGCGNISIEISCSSLRLDANYYQEFMQEYYLENNVDFELIMCKKLAQAMGCVVTSNYDKLLGGKFVVELCLPINDDIVLGVAQDAISY
jgi:hypothetical protein